MQKLQQQEWVKQLNILLICFLFTFYSCGTLPKLYQAAEDIADDDAINIMISREAIQKKTDINISLEIKNNTIQK